MHIILLQPFLLFVLGPPDLILEFMLNSTMLLSVIRAHYTHHTIGTVFPAQKLTVCDVVSQVVNVITMITSKVRHNEVPTDEQEEL